MAIPAMLDGKIRQEQWPDHVRELAFEVWAFRCGRSIPRTVERLASDEYSLPVPRRTVADWVTRYSWDQEADNRLASIAPALRLRRGLTVDAASLDGSYALARILSGDTDASVQEVIAAAKVIFDAAGVTGLGARDRAMATATRSSGGSIPKLSSEDRAALQDRLSRIGQSA